ncbi:uncharacterized protein WM277_009021 [Molossus nigricans]
MGFDSNLTPEWRAVPGILMGKSPHCLTCRTGQVAPNVGLKNGGSSKGRHSSGRQKGKEKRKQRGNLLHLHPSAFQVQPLLLLLLTTACQNGHTGSTRRQQSHGICLTFRHSCRDTGFDLINILLVINDHVVGGIRAVHRKVLNLLQAELDRDLSPDSLTGCSATLSTAAMCSTSHTTA